MTDFFKIITPLLLLLSLTYYYRRSGFVLQKLFLVWLFSFFSFGQNYVLNLRDLHQVIQVTLSFLAILYCVNTNSLTKPPISFLIFGFFIFISLFFNEFDSDASSATINFFSIFVFFWAFIYRKDVLLNFDIILKFWCVSAVILSLAAVLESLVSSIGRAEVTFANPNYLAYVLGVGFCLTHVLKTKSIVLIRLIIFAGILATASRSGIVFVALFLLSEIWYSKSAKRKLLMSMILVMGVIFIVTFLQKNRDGSEASDGERLLISNIVLEIVQDKPIVGVGWGRFINEFGNYAANIPNIVLSTGDEIDFDNRERLVTHNDYFRIASELGLPALIMALFATLMNFKLLLKLQPQVRQWLFPVWLGVVAFSLGHNNLNNVTFWIFFWMPYLYTRLKYTV